jgi:hypothetical protein
MYIKLRTHADVTAGERLHNLSGGATSEAQMTTPMALDAPLADHVPDR